MKLANAYKFRINILHRRDISEQRKSHAQGDMGFKMQQASKSRTKELRTNKIHSCQEATIA
jgi:hypothetical protein